VKRVAKYVTQQMASLSGDG